MRAIDEIEDHETLKPREKACLLQGVSRLLTTSFHPSDLAALLGEHAETFDEVTLRLHDWVALVPAAVAPLVCATTATMSGRMGEWAGSGWPVRTEADLDRYAFDVAGTVGLLLSELWAWHDGTTTIHDHAIGFGRGLQAVNMLSNRDEDLARGADFLPEGWSTSHMDRYARSNLACGGLYIDDLAPGPIRVCCQIMLNLAYAALNATL